MEIAHVALHCRDLERMHRFFRDHFGAVGGEPYHNPKTGLHSRFLSFPDGGARLELMQWPDDAGEEPAPPPSALGFAHLAFSVGGKEAVDAKTRELAAAGWQVPDGPRRRA
jgi:lactoylglutathione lyase